MTRNSEAVGSPTSAADIIRESVIRGTLSPGEHLGQTNLAERFGISKVPVREALKQLAAEGLLEHDHNRGYFVTKLSLEEAEQLYRLRRWIESELLSNARWPSTQEINALRKKFANLEKLNKQGNRSAWNQELREVRLAIFDLSPDKTLLREAKRLWSLTDRYRATLPRDTSGSAELALVDALEHRDRSALFSVYHSHRDEIETALFSVLENSSAKD